MEKQLQRTSFSRSTLDLIERLKGYVQGAWDTAVNSATDAPEEKREQRIEQMYGASLQGLISREFGGIEKMREKIARDVMAHDRILKRLGEDLVTKLIDGPVERRYEVLTRCDRCSGLENGITGDAAEKQAGQSRQKPKKTSKKQSKRAPKNKVRRQAAPKPNKRRLNLGIESQKIPVRKYIYEADFNNGKALPLLVDPKLGEQALRMHCPDCQGTLTSTSSRNLIIPLDDNIFYLIALRVKSAGEYCAKLVDNIFYDEDDPQMRKRDVVDRFGFLLTMNYPGTLHEKVLSREFRKRFGRGIRVDSKRDADLGDSLCYAALDALTAEFDVQRYTLELQDNIANPLEKEMHDRQEQFKQLQFKFGYQGRLLEGKIYTKATHAKESDRKSAVGYESYRTTENKKRQAMFLERPQMRILYEVLLPMFPPKQNVMLRG
jgi:hypothetical protein